MRTPHAVGCGCGPPGPCGSLYCYSLHHMCTFQYACVTLCLSKSSKACIALPLPASQGEGSPPDCAFPGVGGGWKVQEGLGRPPATSLMWNPSHEPLHLSCKEAPALTTLRGGGGRHLQSLLVGPYICIHFTQSLFISKINFSSTDGILRKTTENTAAPLPAVILITHLHVAETRYGGNACAVQSAQLL